MTILSIDAATQIAGAALISETSAATNGYIIIGENNLNTREAVTGARRSGGSAPTHSETLLPMIDGLFKLTGLSLADVDHIACASGPGSFTGLRIGAATAMGLARGANLPLVPVPTLCSLAYNAGSTAEDSDLIVPVMDARREQIYSAFYKFENGKAKRLTDYLAADVDEMLALLPEHEYGRVFFLGDGADAYREKIIGGVPEAKFIPPLMNRQRAASTGVAALHMLRDRFNPSGEFELLYVRKPQAVRDKEARL